jgi:hypothetical protein
MNADKRMLAQEANSRSCRPLLGTESSCSQTDVLRAWKSFIKNRELTLQGRIELTLKEKWLRVWQQNLKSYSAFNSNKNAIGTINWSTRERMCILSKIPLQTQPHWKSMVPFKKTHMQVC